MIGFAAVFSSGAEAEAQTNNKVGWANPLLVKVNEGGASFTVNLKFTMANGSPWTADLPAMGFLIRGLSLYGFPGGSLPANVRWFGGGSDTLSITNLSSNPATRPDANGLLSLTFPVPDDSFINNRTFRFNLAPSSFYPIPSGWEIDSAAATLTIRVADNDAPPGAISLSSLDTEVTEGATAATVNVVLSRAGDERHTGTVRVTTSGSGAGDVTVSGTGYDSATGILSISDASQTVWPLTVTATNDNASDDSETLTISISELADEFLPPGHVINPSGNTHVLTVRDPGLISLSSNDSEIAEGATATLTVNFSRTGMGGEVKVSASGPGADGVTISGTGYRASAESLLITDPNQLTWPLTVTATNDNIAEGAQTLTIRVSAADFAPLPAGYSINTSASTRVLTISPSDNTIGFATTATTVTEDPSGGANTRDITVNINTPFPQQRVVNLTVTESDSDSNADVSITATGATYNSGNNTLTIPANTESFMLTVTAENDAIDDDNETVTLTLSGAPAGWALGATTHTVSVTDDDVPVSPHPVLRVELTKERPVLEGEVAGFRIVSDRNVTADLTVNLRCTVTRTDTHRPPGVYNYTGCEAVIPNGNDFVDVQLAVTDNNIFQFDGGRLTLTILPSPSTYGIAAGGAQEFQNIKDNEPFTGSLTVRFTLENNFNAPHSGTVVPGDIFHILYTVDNTDSRNIGGFTFSHNVAGPGGLFPGAIHEGISTSSNPLGWGSRTEDDCTFGGAQRRVVNGVVEVQGVSVIPGGACGFWTRFRIPDDYAPGRYSNQTSELSVRPLSTIFPAATTPTMVVNPPGFVVQSSATVEQGGETTLTYTIGNNQTTNREYSFSHNIGGSGGLLEGATVQATKCVTRRGTQLGTVTTTGGMLTVSGVQLNAPRSGPDNDETFCTVTATLRAPRSATPNTYTNTTSGVTRSGTTLTNGRTVVLTVTASATPVERFAINVSPSSPTPILEQAEARFVYTLTNDTSSLITDAAFTHNLTHPITGNLGILAFGTLVSRSKCVYANGGETGTVNLPVLSTDPNRGILDVSAVRLTTSGDESRCSITVVVRAPTHFNLAARRTVATSAVTINNGTTEFAPAQDVTITFRSPTIGIYPITTGEIVEGGDAEFRIVSNIPTRFGGVNVNISAVSTQGDFIGSAPGTVTLTADQISATFTVSTVQDGVYEEDGAIRVTVEPHTNFNYVPDPHASSATVNVKNDDVPIISITGPEFVHEGEPLRFTVQSDIELGDDLTVRLGRNQPGVNTVISSTTHNMGNPITVRASGYVQTPWPTSLVIPEGSTSAVYERQTINHRGSRNDDGYFIVEVFCTESDKNACTTSTGGHPDNYSGPSRYSFVETGDPSWTANDPSEKWIQIKRLNPPVVSIASADLQRIRQGEPAVFTVTANSAIPSGGLTVNIATTGSPSGVISGTPDAHVFIPYDGTEVGKTVSHTVPTTSVLGEVRATVQSGTGYTPAGAPDNSAIVRHVGSVPVFSISPAQSPVAEGGDVVFILTANEQIPSIGAFSLPVSITQSGDFVTGALPTAVDFTVGATTATLVVQTEDDAVLEASGAVTATITADSMNPPNWRVSGDAGAATVRINSNDEPISAVGFSGSSQSVYEDPADPDLNRPVVTLEPTSLNRVTVNYVASTESGQTATAGTDYVAASGVLTFNPGEREKRIDLQITDDSASERDETFSLTLSAPTGEAVLGSNTALSLSIISDDGPLASVSSAQDTVAEGTDITFTVSFSSALSTTASVTVPVTVSEEGDFISGTAPSSVTLAASATSATLTVSTVMDGDNEGSGSVTATVPADTMPSPRWRVGDGVSATVAVTSEDAPSTTPVLSIAGPGYVVEGETLPLRIVSDVYVTQELAVNLGCSVGGGFTVSGGCPASAAIPVGANMVALPITVDNDNFYQTDGGTLTVTIEPSTQNPVSYNLHTLTVNTRKTAIIRDNELPDNGELTVRFDPERIVPGQGFRVIYTISNTSGNPANVRFTHALGSGHNHLLRDAYHSGNLSNVSAGNSCRESGGIATFSVGTFLSITRIGINSGSTCTMTADYISVGSTPTGVYSNRTGDVTFPDTNAPVSATFLRGVETPTLTVLPVPTAHVSGPDFVTEGGTHTFRIHSDYEVTRKTGINFSCNTTGGYTVTSSGTEVGDCGQAAVGANIAYQRDFVDIAVTVADNNTEQQSGTLTMAIVDHQFLYDTGSPAAIVVPIVDNDDAPPGSPLRFPFGLLL
ncbi:MAG: hypothetical protein OXF45_03395, partial [Candidatus Dadabacteria bacterium]|nr:hypothetical protein [Candidatus Dadabacteria bacterium]